jgi:hypothetical protein
VPPLTWLATGHPIWPWKKREREWDREEEQREEDKAAQETKEMM